MFINDNGKVINTDSSSSIYLLDINVTPFITSWLMIKKSTLGGILRSRGCQFGENQ